jgi:trans-aconitate methyltransferase
MDLSNLPRSALTLAERVWLRDRAAELDPEAIIVHIGVGLGTSVLCSRAGNPEAAIIGIDLDPGKFAGYQDEMMALVKADSATYQMDGQINFLFIDGDHSEQAVTADIENYTPALVPGGVVAFHDYGWSHLRWCAGVKAAVDKRDWTGWREIPAPDSIKAYERTIE